MCLKVYIAKGDESKCSGSHAFNPDCPGEGSQPYQSGVTQDWAYSAKLSHDENKGLDYFIGVIIEWFDRCVSVQQAQLHVLQFGAFEAACLLCLAAHVCEVNMQQSCRLGEQVFNKYYPALNVCFSNGGCLRTVPCRNQTLPYALTYPVQGLDTDKFGNWPIEYEGTPCPVGNDSVAYQFLDNSKAVSQTPHEQPSGCGHQRCAQTQNY